MLTGALGSARGLVFGLPESAPGTSGNSGPGHFGLPCAAASAATSATGGVCLAVLSEQF